MLFFLSRDRRELVTRDADAATPEARHTSVLDSLRALFGQPPFLALLGYFTLFALTNWGINGWLPTC